jgi:predicted transcriptional regulator
MKGDHMMQNNTLTITQTPARKLERVRERVRVVTRAVQTTEGRLLDFDTADDIMRTLHTAARELEELTVTVAVMQRRTHG